MERKRSDRIQSLNDIANSIIKMTGDDEILTKISLTFISSLKTAIENNEQLTKFYDPSSIAINFWPYGSPPQAGDDEINEIPEINQLGIQPTLDHPTRRTMNDNSLHILHKMQQETGKKLSQFDLIHIAKHISTKLKIPLKKRERQSKVRVLEWIQTNFEIIEPALPELLHEYKNFATENEE